jgi:pyruvate dehydrogenase kinase 2/3/4
LEGVAARLQGQAEACRGLLALERGARPSRGAQTAASGGGGDDPNLRHLLRVHEDTLGRCLQLASRPVVFERWSGPDQRAVASVAEEVRSRHAPGLERWAELASAGPEEGEAGRAEALSRVLQRRLGIQLLCDQIVKLEKGGNAVASECDVVAAVHEAYTEAAALCDSHWQAVPDLEIEVAEDPPGTGSSADHGARREPEEFAAVRAAVIRPWLHHALVELFKNAMNASVLQALRRMNGGTGASSGALSPTQLAHKLQDPLAEVPRLTVRVRATGAGADADGDCDGDVSKKGGRSSAVVVDIQDRGVGLGDGSPPSVARMFLLGAAARPTGGGRRRRWDRLDVQQSYAAVRSPLHGLGVGLPVSRLMMRHFGGDVALLLSRQGGDRDDPGGGSSWGGAGCLARIRIPLDPDLPEPDAAVRFEG